MHTARSVARLLAALLMLWLSIAPARAEGYAVPIGGALSYENDEVWSRLVKLAGGRDARFVVFGTASEDPRKASERIVATLRKHGAQAEFIPLSAPSPGRPVADEQLTRQWSAQVSRATGVYFAGGAQERITSALLPQGRPTPVLDAIWGVYRKGGVVAGSSAGAAIMSEVMFRDAQDVLMVMKNGMRDGKEIDRGLGFVGPGLFIDQHFLRRGRVGRMIPLMQSKGIEHGIGVEEDSAAIIHGRKVGVIGSKGAVLVDLTQSERDSAMAAFNVRHARLHYLESGDAVDLDTMQVAPSPAKRSGALLDPAAPDFAPYYDRGAFYPDFLGDGTLAAAMARLLDSRATEVRGLAFGAPGEQTGPANLGFEFRLYKGAGTRGWLSTASGSEAYTVTGVYLDIVPVKLAEPLYSPWRGGR